MRVYVTGGTTMIGRALIPELLAHGHDVVALARTDASKAMLRAMKATIYSGQGRDTGRLGEAICQVHAVVHLATSIPVGDQAVEDAWPFSAGVLTGLLKSLLTASEACGVRTIVLPGFYGVYGNQGENAVTEANLPLAPDPISQAFVEAEKLLQRSNVEKKSAGVILRLGRVYAADSTDTRGLIYGIKHGQAPILSSANRYWPVIHAKDAARAIRLAVEQSPAGEVFNVCDNEPVQQGKLYEELAQWMSAPPPPRQGTSELRPYMGLIDNPAMAYSVRMSNRKVREKLGFNPQYPTYREGYAAVLRDLAAEEFLKK